MKTSIVYITRSTTGMKPNDDTVSGVTDDNVTVPKLHSSLENASVPEGCMEVRFNQLGYIPWDNPDNIVSAETENIFKQIEVTALAILVLIGGPANIINMVVFYKQGLKSRVNLCLFALSLADLLHLTVAIFVQGEQVHRQFTTRERYGPVVTFMLNNNLIGFFGFQWVAQVLTAVIATERCLCVLSPLKAQTLFSTRRMAIIVVIVYVVVVGLFFVVAFKYRVSCVFDPVLGIVSRTFVTGKLFETYKELVTYLDSFIFGGGLPGTVIIVVMTTTILTTIKLRQVMTWRTETSSAVSVSEVGLTKMLVANSVLFIVCAVPDALFRFACVFLPEMSTGGRNRNFYMSFLWLLDIVAFINSSFNMFVYYAMGSRYRETFWALFRIRQTDQSNK